MGLLSTTTTTTTTNLLFKFHSSTMHPKIKHHHRTTRPNHLFHKH
jgi:hypothetical protein